MRKKTNPEALPPRLLLVLLALMGQDCSAIELDELMGTPGRGRELIYLLRKLVQPGLITSTDEPMRYRITDRAEAQRLVDLAEPEQLAAARQRLDAHRNSDSGAVDMKVLLSRAMARFTTMRATEAAAAKRKKKGKRAPPRRFAKHHPR